MLISDDIPTCPGCNKITPFFGGIYGRMSKARHGDPVGGMGHLAMAGDFIKTKEVEFVWLNDHKNKLLIPFYGTILAIQSLKIVKNLYSDQATDFGFSLSFQTNLVMNKELSKWYTLRLQIALIPIAGTLINGALDLIAQVGMQLKTKAIS